MNTIEEIDISIDTELDTLLDRELSEVFQSSLVLYNDDTITFDHVINCLIRYCRHVPLQAEQCAFIVHNNGKCEIKRGSIRELKPIFDALLENHLAVKIV